MPTYEYQCDSCRRVFEIRQRISDPPLATCDACGGAVRRLLSPAPFILKGDGWYVTDYPSEARKKAREAEKSASGSTTSSGESGASTDKGATDKTVTDKPASSATTSTAPKPSASASTAPAAD